MIWGAVIATALIAGVFFFRTTFDKKSAVTYRECRAETGSIRQVVSTTATIKPQNRLEIKSPVNGRIDRILVKEGEYVRKGQVLALISSSERAALLDAATLKGRSEIEYWNRVYNQTALISPIDGQVIVSSLDPGQTITTSDAVLVLSDRLIVKTDVDETDIGNVRVGQKAEISLDAYPEIRVEGVVDHIYYESTLVSNVNIYQVDIVPASVPEVFRSGMSANVDIVTAARKGVLLLPTSVITTEGGRSTVLVRESGTDKPKRVVIRTGIQDETNTEILAGLSPQEVVLVRETAYSVPRKKTGTNPFLPKRPEERRQQEKKRGEG
jgi:macrolide-specific efflux system membrane fusion protein